MTMTTTTTNEGRRQKDTIDFSGDKNKRGEGVRIKKRGIVSKEGIYVPPFKKNKTRLLI